MVSIRDGRFHVPHSHCTTNMQVFLLPERFSTRRVVISGSWCPALSTLDSRQRFWRNLWLRRSRAVVGGLDLWVVGDGGAILHKRL